MSNFERREATQNQANSRYGIQTIGQRGQSNAGQQGGYNQSLQFGGGVGPFQGMTAGPSPAMLAQQAQQRLQQQRQVNEQQGLREERRIQQEMQNAAPVQNYVDTWQMTPEKVAAYRAAKQGNPTSMQQQPQGMGGQLQGQQAIANLLRMLGLG